MRQVAILFYKTLPHACLFTVLVGGFAEDTHSDLSAGFPSGKAISNAEYEYDEDSDLDDEIEIEGDSADANAKDSSTDSGVALLDQVEHEESPAASETSQQRREPKVSGRTFGCLDQTSNMFVATTNRFQCTIRTSYRHS